MIQVNYLLGIDIGTSSCKSVLADMKGERIATSVVEYEAVFLPPDGIEQDPETWWQAVIECVHILFRDNPSAGHGVVAVGVTGQMRGITMLGADGTVLRRSILWNDRRCRAEVREISERYPEAIGRITRNPLNEMCSLPKILWLRAVEPELFGKVAKIIYPKDYIRYRLTGNLATDVSDASGSSLFDLNTGEWSEELLGRFSLPQRMFPPVYSSTDIAGSVTRGAASELGLLEGTPVAVGASDATAEMVGLGIVHSSQCKLRLGTSGALSTITFRPPTKGESIYVWSYLDRSHWMVDTNTRSCGQSVEWIRRVCYSEAESSESAYGVMEGEAVSVPPGADGVVFHPYLLGEDAPYWNSELKGSFFGLSAAHRRGHLVRAVLEGTCFALKDALTVFEDAGYEFSQFFVVGGGAKNKLWIQILADIVGQDLEIVESAEAAMGAAVLAGTGVKVFAGVEAASAAINRVSRRVRVSAERREEYDVLFRAYRTMAKVYKGLYSVH